MTRIPDRLALRRTASWALVACCVLACTAPGSDDPARAAPLVGDGRLAMGTVLELSLVANDEHSGRRWIDDAFRRVALLEGLFSRYDPESQLSRLNDAAGAGMQEVDPRLGELLELALDYRSLTRGCFDVSVAPLVELWSHASERQETPSPAEIARVRAQVGAAALRLDGRGRAGLASADAAVDLGGIAKGYALDRLASDLRNRGYADALLSFGQSSVRALGSPPGESGWRLMLRDPAGGFAGIVSLRDRALSVSSSLAQWSSIDGERYGHVIDPRSGWPVARGIQAAVIAPTAALAEALSTALVVLGEVEGVALVEGIASSEAMIMDASGSVSTTRGWLRESGFEPPPADLASSSGRASELEAESESEASRSSGSGDPPKP